MNLQDLKETVIKLLVSDFEFLMEEAETAVEESSSEDPAIWSENADPEDLANFLASDEVDD